MDDTEAAELAALAKTLRISRAGLIRRACTKYVQGLREAELDREYERGYLAIPEDSAVSSASATLAGMLLQPEDWADLNAEKCGGRICHCRPEDARSSSCLATKPIRSEVL